MGADPLYLREKTVPSAMKQPLSFILLEDMSYKKKLLAGRTSLSVEASPFHDNKIRPLVLLTILTILVAAATVANVVYELVIDEYATLWIELGTIFIV